MPWEIGWRSKKQFVSDGIMLAVPLCFPGQSVPPTPGETAMTCLAPDPAGSLYMGTTGSKAHVLAAVLHGESGIVWDLGAVPDAKRVSGILANQEQIYLLAEGDDGPARLMSNGRFSRDFLIQEWGFRRNPYVSLLDLPAEKILSALAVDEDTMVALSDKGEILRINVLQPSVDIVARLEAPFSGIMTLLDGNICFADAFGIVQLVGDELQRLAECRLPLSAITADEHDKILYFASSGVIYRLVEGTIEELGKPCRAETIACMTVGFDGRLFGMAGDAEDLAHLFVFNPKDGTLEDRGVPVSTLTARQYGYQFACAMTGPGGEIYFGQHERVNHLWVYLPEMLPR